MSYMVNTIARNNISRLSLGLLMALLITGCSSAEKIEKQKAEQIQENSVQISETQIQIEEKREEVDKETRKLRADPDNASKVYDGPTIGQYNR